MADRADTPGADTPGADNSDPAASPAAAASTPSPVAVPSTPSSAPGPSLSPAAAPSTSVTASGPSSSGAARPAATPLPAEYGSLDDPGPPERNGSSRPSTLWSDWLRHKAGVGQVNGHPRSDSTPSSADAALSDPAPSAEPAAVFPGSAQPAAASSSTAAVPGSSQPPFAQRATPPADAQPAAAVSASAKPSAARPAGLGPALSWPAPLSDPAADTAGLNGSPRTQPLPNVQADTRRQAALPSAAQVAWGSAAPAGLSAATAGSFATPAGSAAAFGAAPSAFAAPPSAFAVAPDALAVAPAQVQPAPTRRAAIRHVDIGSVVKVSLAFYTVVLVVFVIAGLLLWVAADALGTLHSIDKSIRTLFALKSFTLHPSSVAMYAAAAAVVVAVAGTLANVIMALIYNLIADAVGGIRVRLDHTDLR